eukprot:Selendium_serpulae@DN8712_c0_g1_i1.p2
MSSRGAPASVREFNILLSSNYADATHQVFQAISKAMKTVEGRVVAGKTTSFLSGQDLIDLYTLGYNFYNHFESQKDSTNKLYEAHITQEYKTFLEHYTLTAIVNASALQ